MYVPWMEQEKMSVVREIKVLCLFNKKDKCNSDYAKGLECNGVHPPKKCPYHYNLNPKEMKLKLKWKNVGAVQSGE